ncbi:MobQ family relaxase [Acinetobacter tandoii]|uniref:MobQ family relaxase n=1 Tax=Acinetobacter tandoii TaxID=202954 RepID=UPI001D172461|nr:MobQ family relaxase [Acinetobacter tandoii]
MEVREGTPLYPKPSPKGWAATFSKLQKAKPRYAKFRFLKMAIFHLNESNISRSDGRSVVACAAYRACEKLLDHTFGKTQDYTRKKGLEYKSIYAPEHTNEKLLDRQTLWNEVEKKEFNADGSMKANARLAKEYTCALPHELTHQERIKIVDDFCRDFVKKHNVIVDACIHAPHDHDDETDNKNYHVHIMFTTRLVNEKGELGKKQRTFNDDGPKILKDSRATFAHVVNTALENAGLEERIDHRSYKDQGLDFLEATAHEGHEVTALRRQGIDTEISLKNDAIKAKNLEAAREYQQVIKGLDQEIIVPNKLEDQIAALEKELSLTAAEEQQLLAELAKLDREELLQEQLTQQIDNAYDNFIEQQAQYIEFAQRFYDYDYHTNKRFEELDKQLEKSQKWLSKQHGFYYSGGVFYDNYHHQRIDVSTPYYFTTHSKIATKKEEIMKQYRKDLSKLADDFDIENTISALKQNAKKLTDNAIELPVPAPTFMQKLRREYVHSFDTLDDFKTDMKPVFDEYRAETLRAEKEKQKKIEEAENLEAFRQRTAEQKRKRDAERELEMKRLREERQQLRQSWANEPEPEKKPKKDNDFDLSM